MSELRFTLITLFSRLCIEKEQTGQKVASCGTHVPVYVDVSVCFFVFHEAFVHSWTLVEAMSSVKSELPGRRWLACQK